MTDELEEIEYSPGACPNCGSLNTYWSNMILWIFECEDCGVTIDDDWYMEHQPTIIKGKNYPEDE